MKSYLDKSKTPVTHHVHYQFISDTGKVLNDVVSVCFGGIVGGKIPDKAVAIVLIQDRESAPYTHDAIERWVADLNDIGFPCTFFADESVKRRREFARATNTDGYSSVAEKVLAGDIPAANNKSSYKFRVNLADYTYKVHVIHTLMFLRMLYEPYLNPVPEKYFQLMDDNSTGDKFRAIQVAQRLSYKGDNGHMMTWAGNGINVLQANLMRRYEKNGVTVHEVTRVPLSQHWCGKKTKKPKSVVETKAEEQSNA